MNFKDVLEEYGYTVKTFSEKFGIKRRTVENWSYRGCPDYLLLLISLYLKLNQDFINLQSDYKAVIEERFSHDKKGDQGKS